MKEYIQEKLMSYTSGMSKTTKKIFNFVTFASRAFTSFQGISFVVTVFQNYTAAA